MKAAVIRAHGEAGVLEYLEWPDPSPGPGEVLVRVRACALNHRDIWVRRGLREKRLPHILGADIAGEVTALGPGVHGVTVGARVILYPALTCGRCAFCRRGEENACVEIRVLGGAVDGGYAELIAVPGKNVFAMPEGATFSEAASLPVAFLTAWHMLVTRCCVTPGEAVLVVGGSSGIGSAAIQIAKLFGATVIATAGTDDKRQHCRDLGADHTVDHYKQSIAEEVRRLTDGRGADVVFEHVGPATWPQSLTALARRGRLAICGQTTGNEVTLDLVRFFAQNQTIHGTFIGTGAEFFDLLRLVSSGRLRPVVDHVFPLSEAAAAHRRMERGEHFGKIVLSV
ncbi:MAG: zinc-binding dehydrogenase [Candidatus Rokubacteria bacterium]|nr:zinc-binding dehydrogenase [Candidatus Rokubacteria bacterium]